MEAKELRIGNFILANETGSFANYSAECMVAKISDNDQISVKISQYDGVEFDNVLSILMEPIPLTEEWLANLGFIKTEPDSIFDYPYWSIDGVEILFQSDQTFLFNASCGNIPIHFVHQIQNLYFVLMGKDLVLQKL